jgi:hypothetical protein
LSEQVAKVSEVLLKMLVNDWSASQAVPQ